MRKAPSKSRKPIENSNYSCAVVQKNVPGLTAQVAIYELDFDYSAKVEAAKIYILLNIGNTRADNRKKAICYCIYQGYLNIGKYYDVVHIGRKLKLPSDQAKESISSFSRKFNLVDDTYEFHSGDVDIEIMMEYYTSSFEQPLTQETTEELKSLCSIWEQEIINTKFSKREFITGLVYNYFRANGIQVNDMRFSHHFDVTIDRLHLVSTKLKKFVNA